MRSVSLLFLALMAVVLSVAPASASYLLSGYVLSPDQPLVPGTPQQIVASYALLPTGEANFVRGHELQMQTGLSGARWNIQVVVDGRDTAQQTANGNAAFINGELLSIPSSHDVTLEVTVSGTVPPASNGTVLLLLAEEIDNSGSVVPGSAITINQPVQVVNATPSPSASPVPSAAATGQQAATPRSPGFVPVAGIAALAAGIAIRQWRCR